MSEVLKDLEDVSAGIGIKKEKKILNKFSCYSTRHKNCITLWKTGVF
jgi:hypothetical protein